MRKNVFFLFCMFAMQMMAQEEKFRITFNVGDPLNFNVKDIKEITFLEDLNPLDIEGNEWFNEEIEKYGTYESFEFREDGSLLYHPYYVNYHSGLTINGYYNLEDYMLTMQLGDLGVLTTTITNHSATSFVVTSGGENRTYYKVQKVYNIKTSDAPMSIGNDGDIITFVDNEFITIEDNKIKPLKGGTGYALVKDLALDAIVAYRINVEAVRTTKDWTQYFKKTKDEIISEFGEPFMTQDEGNTYWYLGNDPAFTYMLFSFDKDSGKMYSFYGMFVDGSELESYKNYIEKTYIKDENKSTATNVYYYNTDKSVSINIDLETMSIIYIDLDLL